jgi:hypothetical protein
MSGAAPSVAWPRILPSPRPAAFAAPLPRSPLAFGVQPRIGTSSGRILPGCADGHVHDSVPSAAAGSPAPARPARSSPPGEGRGDRRHAPDGSGPRSSRTRRPRCRRPPATPRAGRTGGKEGGRGGGRGFLPNAISYLRHCVSVQPRIGTKLRRGLARPPRSALNVDSCRNLPDERGEEK